MPRFSLLTSFANKHVSIGNAPPFSVVAGGLYDVEMIFSGSCSTTAHQSGGIRATIENGGLWSRDMAPNP